MHTSLHWSGLDFRRSQLNVQVLRDHRELGNYNSQVCVEQPVHITIPN